MTIFGFTIDFWTIWGFAAQGFYFARFVIQWIRSEKEGKIVVPHVFWVLSLCGAIMTLIYALARNDLVFLVTAILQFFLFGRNFFLSKKTSIKSSNKLITGNYTDKYHSKNPINRYLMGRFLSNFQSLLIEAKSANIKTICEIGCGEGELLKIIHHYLPNAKIYATDIGPSVIKQAKDNTNNIPILFSVQNAEKLNYKNQQFDLVICCEVLEHLKNPQLALNEIQRIGKSAILSVPIEPWWRILNFMRFKYISYFGNTPGHLNHWSVKKFKKMLSPMFAITKTKNTFPWQMYFCRPKN